MCRLTEKQSYEVPLGLSGGPQLHKQENSIRAASTNEAEDNDDPYDKMVTFLTGRTKSERTSKERAIIFPVKLMYVLECGKYNHIVGWKLDEENNEQHFIVYDIDAFTETVLPTLFKVAKYDSFQRKLYRWGFIKTRRTKADKLQLPKAVCYVHPFFRQGDYNGAAKMTCSGANVELCKTEQKKRKRQQRVQGPKISNKKTPVSNSNVKKNEEHNSFAPMPSLGNFQHLLVHDPLQGGMEARIPSLLPNAFRMNGCERIDDSTTLPVLSRDTSALKSQLQSRVPSSSSRSSSPDDDDDISKLLARAKAQRQLQRIQLNNLMRDKLLKEMQEDSFFDEIGMDLTSPTPYDDVSSSALEEPTEVAVNADESSSATGSLSGDSYGNQMTNNQQQRKQGNSLFQYQDTLMMTGRSYSNRADYRQKRREVHQRIISDALDVLKL